MHHCHFIYVPPPPPATTIGLIETLITVNESVGMRQVCAAVLDGDLERRAEATLTLHPHTAMRKI